MVMMTRIPYHRFHTLMSAIQIVVRLKQKKQVQQSAQWLAGYVKVTT